MTKNTTTTNKYRIPADRIQNLEIDRNGRIAPRLHDLEPTREHAAQRALSRNQGCQCQRPDRTSR